MTDTNIDAIRAYAQELQSEAAEYSDLVTRHACRLVLGLEEALSDADAFEKRYGGWSTLRVEREGIIGMTVDDAADLVHDLMRQRQI